MKTLKTVLATLVVVALLAPLAALGVVYSGAYNVAATSGHLPITDWLLSKAVHNSVAARAETVHVPPLGSRDQILAGAANYEAMCAGCHSSPGKPETVVASGMVPAPPDLAHAAGEMTPAELFWVIKYGIKASGMPAWGPSHSDEDIWSMVALIQRFPQMSASDYEQLRQAADAGGMDHHGHGGDTHAEGDSDANDETSEARAPEETDTSAGTEAAHGADGHPH